MVKKLFVLLIALGFCFTLGGYNKADAMELEVGTIGDLLLFSLYDVRETADRSADWQNYMVIENTSPKWTAIQIRFRSWKKSIEVFDRVVLLSPYDVFWMWWKLDEDKKVYMQSRDENTLRNSGMLYPEEALPYKEYFRDNLLRDCGWTGTEAELQQEMQAGHIEVIGLFQMSFPLDPILPVTEDAHVLSSIVANLYTGDEDAHTSTINVFDLMQGLYYQHYVQPLPPVPAVVPVADWPAAVGAKGPGVLETAGGATPGSVANETGTDGYERNAEDCTNVLAAVLELGDGGTGRYEIENYVAVRDFRTGNVANTQHRDQAGAPIVFPYEVLVGDPTYDMQANMQAWYINENWSSMEGPGLRDGDDVYVAPAPGIMPFNNIYSLDDLEDILRKAEIWYHYFYSTVAVINTDFIITFPTKHYHWFFEQWPYFQGGNFPGPAQYVATVGPPAKTAAENYWDDVDAYREDIKWAFDYYYDNGPIGAKPFLWDMEQFSPEGELPPPPPGSPWHPVFKDPKYIPHEVNIVRVGAEDPLVEGAITDADGLLTLIIDGINQTPDQGHFVLRAVALTNGLRGTGFVEASPHPIYGFEDDLATYALPSIGVMRFVHMVTGEVVSRSTMCEWHYQRGTSMLP